MGYIIIKKYIREDADLEKAADIIVNSSFENSG